MLGAYFGLRRGEIIGLKWDSIDFAKGTLTVNGTMDVKKRYKAEAKTKESVRTLIMPEYAKVTCIHLKKHKSDRERNWERVTTLTGLNSCV